MYTYDVIEVRRWWKKKKGFQKGGHVVNNQEMEMAKYELEGKKSIKYQNGIEWN